MAADNAKEIEAMARAHAKRFMADADTTAAMQDGLNALIALHPGVRALLDGEAVAVPREATEEMAAAGNEAMDDGMLSGVWFAMLRASPYAQKQEASDAG
jgi:hypothetical protein